MAEVETKSMLKERPLLMLIDGHAIVHRAWHAMKNPLTIRKTGEEVRAVYGFTMIFLKALQDWHPTHCIVTFDRPTPTFRHQQFDAYKAQRPETPQELRDQFIRVRQLLMALNVPIYEIDGFEADDLLGTLSRQAAEKSMESLIITGDTDTLQLVSPWVRVQLHHRVQEQMLFDEAAVRQRYGGLSPYQLPDFKGLQGDSSDNIPGVPGIGEKTAIKLLSEYKDIQGLTQNLDKVEPQKLREALIAHREQMLQSKELATIVTTVPVALDLEAALCGQYSRQVVIDCFREMEFFSLVDKVPEGMKKEEAPASSPATSVKAQVSTTEYRTVATPEALEELGRELSACSLFSLDTETTGKDPMLGDLVGLSFATSPGRAFYVPVGHQGSTGLLLEQALKVLKPLLEDPTRHKVAHNGNFDMTVLANHGVMLRGLEFDTMVAAFLIGKKALGLKALALDMLGEVMTPISSLIGTGKGQRNMAQVSLEEASPYACADADMTLRLQPLLAEGLDVSGLLRLFRDVEMPLVPVLVQMQLNGIALDTHLLGEMSRSLHDQIAKLEGEIYGAVGHEFNIGSPKQLSDILFRELRIQDVAGTHLKRTKTGSYTTDASALEELKDTHPVVNLILEYRILTKLKSTYVDALPQMVNPRTRRLHTSYNQAGAVTGRISSNDPNLQNIPIRTELGRQVRRAFVAGEQGWVLMGADYSQIELRVLAHISQDQGLLRAFHQDEDIHAATASSVYNVPLDQVSQEMRRIAKIMNFGVIYGLSAYGISQQTDLNPEEGTRFIDSYFSKYPGIRDYIEATKEKALKLGYVETLLGRRRAIPEIASSNHNTRGAAEREAINMPIQGTAADIMKIAMIQMHEAIKAKGLKSLMLLQVHDELIFEVPQDEVEMLKSLVQEVMPRAMELAVPLKVSLKTGITWGDLE